jgi:Mg2+/Co2+ transporter CorB
MLLEVLQDIPEAPISVKAGNCIVEVVQAQDQAIKVVKLRRPEPRLPE